MFKELAPLLRQRSVLLSVTRLEDDNIRVNVFPKKLSDSENEALTTPMSVSGSAEELDAHLPSALTEYVGANLGLSSTLQTAKEQMEAAAKKAKDEAKSKTTAKTVPAKAGAPETPAGKQPSEKPEAKAAAAAPKPAEVKKPEAPKTASLFDFSAPAPALSAPPEREPADEEEEIMAEINEESTTDDDDIAA